MGQKSIPKPSEWIQSRLMGSQVGSQGAKGYPREPKGSPMEPQREPKGSQREAKGPLKEPKGSPKGGPGSPIGAKREPKGGQREPKGGQKGPKTAPKRDQKVICFDIVCLLRILRFTIVKPMILKIVGSIFGAESDREKIKNELAMRSLPVTSKMNTKWHQKSKKGARK